MNLNYQGSSLLDTDRGDETPTPLDQAMAQVAKSDLLELWVAAPLLGVNQRSGPPNAFLRAFAGHSGEVLGVAPATRVPSSRWPSHLIDAPSCSPARTRFSA